MKTLVTLFLFVCASLARGSGYEYTVHQVTSSHAPIYTTEDFKTANIAIHSSLLRDDLILRAEVFIVPSGPGYTVIIGKIDAKATLSDRETRYIYDEVRRILIEAKLECETKTSSNDPANQPLERNDHICHASCGARFAPAAVVAHL